MVRTFILIILAACCLAPATPLFADNVVTTGTRFKVYTVTPRFAVRKAELREADRAELDRIADEWRGVQNVRVQAIGHTDSVRIAPENRHEFRNNYVLSEARAASVAQYLSHVLGLSQEQIVVVGKGPDEPVASNESTEGRAQNRRVELTIRREAEIHGQSARPVDLKEVDDLKSELERIQRRLAVLEAEDEDLIHRLSDMVSISGYADGEYIMTDKKGDNNRFRVHHLSLFFKKQISEQWRLFTEIEYEDAPKLSGTDDGSAIKDTEGKVFVEVFTLEYYLNRYLNFRLGRFLTPGGIWNVEHYPPFVLTQERPQHIRKIFPQLQDGLQLLGSANLANVVTDYIFYVSNGQGNTGHGDGNEDKALGTRIKFKLPYLSTIETGFSYYVEEKNNEDEIRSAGADLLIQWGGLKFQGEYAKEFIDLAAGSGFQEIGYYGQLQYDYRKWTLGYRYDWYDKNTKADDDRKTINTIVLNYHFTPDVVVKAEHHFNDPQDRTQDNFTKTLLSVAVYLGD